MGAGMILVGAVPALATILLGYAVWGLGYTFTSGAYEAWITDEVGAGRVGRVFARGQQLSYAGALAGTGVSVAIASYSLGLAVAARDRVHRASRPRSGSTRCGSCGRRP